MFDAFWSEILIIAIIALIFLGPSELLILLRSLGKWSSKIQQTVNDIKMSIDYEVDKKNKKDED